MRFLISCLATMPLIVNAARAQEVQPELLGLLQACEQTVITSEPDPMSAVGIEVRELLAGLFRFEGDAMVDGHPMEIRVQGSGSGASCAFRLIAAEVSDQPPHPGPTLEAWLQTASPAPRETFFDPRFERRMYYVCDGDVTYGAAVEMREFTETERRRATERGVTLSDDAVALQFQALPMSANECAALNARLDAENLRGT